MSLGSPSCMVSLSIDNWSKNFAKWLNLLRYKGWLIIFDVFCFYFGRTLSRSILRRHCFYFGRTLSRSILRRHRNWPSKVAPTKTTENEIQRCQVEFSNWQKHFLCVSSLSKSACFLDKREKRMQKYTFFDIKIKSSVNCYKNVPRKHGEIKDSLSWGNDNFISEYTMLIVLEKLFISFWLARMLKMTITKLHIF